jgi:hypothetical protein
MPGLILIVCMGIMVLAGSTISSAVIITGGGAFYDGQGIPVREYSTFPSLIRCLDGSLLCYDLRSTDGGKTWPRAGHFGFPLSDATRPYRGASATLKDGTILLVGRYTRKHEWEKDVFVTEVYRSRDHFASYDGPLRGHIYVPQVAAGTDEYGQPADGPFFEHSLVEMPNGNLMAPMWGWFTQDQTPSDYPDRWDKWKL